MDVSDELDVFDVYSRLLFIEDDVKVRGVRRVRKSYEEYFGKKKVNTDLVLILSFIDCR